MSHPSFIHYQPLIESQVRSYANFIDKNSTCPKKALIEKRSDIFIEDAADFVQHVLDEWNRSPEKYSNDIKLLNHKLATKIHTRLLSLARCGEGGDNGKETGYKETLASFDADMLRKMLRCIKRDEDIGRKWLFIASQLSHGAVILCGDKVARVIYSSSWRQLYHIVMEIERDYAEAVHIFQLLDPFVKALLAKRSDNQTDLTEISQRITEYLSET